MTKLVFSYSHKDEELRNQLETHLAPLKRQGLINSWHDRRINAGDEFEKEIDKNFLEADVILLLISPDFIASDYCYHIEMTQAIQRHNRGEVRVIPVILRPCHWQSLPFGKLMAAPKDGKPITKFTTYDEFFFAVVEEITKTLDAIKPPASLANQQSSFVNQSEFFSSQEPSMLHGTKARSSNLRIKRNFSDKERDDAINKCFDYISNFFENSLEEIKKRTPSIDTNFRRIDANSFEASIYVNGSKKCHCGIWISSLYSSFRGNKQICYSHNGVTLNSMNGSIYLKDDGYSLGFSSTLDMFNSSHNRDTLLSDEGVSENFWEQFISPLQR